MSNYQARTAALGAVAGPVMFTLAWLVLGFLSPGFTLFGTRIEPYSAIHHPVSGLGLGPTGPVMNGAFIALGILLMAGAAGIFHRIRELGTFARWSCIALFALPGAGAILDGLFTLEAFLPHFVGFGLACGSPVLGFPIVGLALRRVPRWRRLGRWLIGAGPVTLALLVLSMATFDQAEAAAGRGVAGLTQRALIVELQFWFAALGWAAFREGGARPPVVGQFEGAWKDEGA